MSRKKSSFVIATILLTFFLCLIVAEIAIRVDNFVGKKRRKIFIPEPYLGFVHAPDNKFLWEDNRGKEFALWQRTNALGLMGEDVTVRKPENVYRIIVLGDSFTEAMQIEEGLNFCNQLEELLNKNRADSQKKFEVINAGVSGYSPISEYLFFKRRLKELQPDLVLLQLWANDIFEDQKATAMSVIGESGLPVKINRYFTKKYDEPGVSFQLNPLLYHLHNSMVRVSRFYEYMYSLFVKLNKNKTYHREMTAHPEYDDHNQFALVLSRNPLYSDADFRARAQALTQRYILALRDEATSVGAHFMAFYIPFEGQLPFEKHGGDTKLYTSYQAGTEINTFLADVFARHDIDFHDFYADFMKRLDEDFYIDWDGHLNERGHELTAQILYEKLKR